MLVPIAVVVVVLVGALLAYAATRPDSLHVTRTAGIGAPPEKIFPHINDFHRWVDWSPYEGRDPTMKRTHSGAAEGRGAVYEWPGNRQVGSGRMEITDTAYPSRITITLDFITPFEGHNVAEFTLVPRDGQTNVTWSMKGPSAFMTKLVGVFLNMDTMIGKDFETGLANLKALAEK
ncbi:MAG: SRPBCC family protein [Vicinamibacterales bacterium]